MNSKLVNCHSLLLLIFYIILVLPKIVYIIPYIYLLGLFYFHSHLILVDSYINKCETKSSASYKNNSMLNLWWDFVLVQMTLPPFLVCYVQMKGSCVLWSICHFQVSKSLPCELSCEDLGNTFQVSNIPTLMQIKSINSLRAHHCPII